MLQHLSKVNALNRWIVLSLFFVLPLDNKYTNLVIVVLALATLIEQIVIPGRKSGSLFWFLPVLFLYYLLSGAVSGAGWQIIEKYSLLLIIPLIFFFNARLNDPVMLPKICWSFVAGCCLALLLCIANAFQHSLSFTDHGWRFDPRIVADPEHDYLSSAVYGGNYFFGEEFSIFHHPTYFALILVVGVLILFMLHERQQPLRYNLLLFFTFCFFALGIFLLSSKAALLSFVFLTVGISIVLIKRMRGAALKTALIVFFVGALGFLIATNPRFRVFRETLDLRQLFTPDPEARWGHDLRVLSWHASLGVIKQNLLFGVGEGKKAEKLLQKYDEYGYTVPKQQLHNSHNQYLDYLIGGGVFALILFVGGLIHASARAVKTRNYPLLVFIGVFAFNCLFENLCSRHAGLLLLSVFLCFFQSGMLTPRTSIDSSHRPV